MPPPQYSAAVNASHSFLHASEASVAGALDGARAAVGGSAREGAQVRGRGGPEPTLERMPGHTV